jgi:hypothetical protein
MDAKLNVCLILNKRLIKKNIAFFCYGMVNCRPVGLFLAAAYLLGGLF